MICVILRDGHIPKALCDIHDTKKSVELPIFWKTAPAIARSWAASFNLCTSALKVKDQWSSASRRLVWAPESRPRPIRVQARDGFQLWKGAQWSLPLPFVLRKPAYMVKFEQGSYSTDQFHSNRVIYPISASSRSKAAMRALTTALISFKSSSDNCLPKQIEVKINSPSV